MAKELKLTAKQQRFVQEYCRHFNATKAARDAGYSENTASETGYENLNKPQIKAAIADRMAAMDDDAAVTTKRIVREMKRLAFSDLRSCFNDDGTLKPVHEWDDDAAAAVASLEVVTVNRGGGEDAVVDYVHKIKTWDKNSALEKLAKHFGMFQPEAQSSEIHVHLHEKADKF